MLSTQVMAALSIMALAMSISVIGPDCAMAREKKLTGASTRAARNSSAPSVAIVGSDRARGNYYLAKEKRQTVISIKVASFLISEVGFPAFKRGCRWAIDSEKST